MNYRRIAGLIGSAAAGVLGAGAQIAQAQDHSGSNVDLGGSIRDTVNGAVSARRPVATAAEPSRVVVAAVEPLPAPRMWNTMSLARRSGGGCHL